MPVRRAPWDTLGAAALLAALTILAYWPSFSAPFVFDDIPAIVGNPTIRHWATAFSPPLNTTASGRPVLNLSLAFNYALGGTAPAGYHILNLAIHVLAGLTLFGLVRRTLEARAHKAAFGIAVCAALLWLLHPLQTEAVTYVAQRAESLMGLFYLLTLYAFLRAATAERSKGVWFALSIAACLLGMGTKEVMVSAPILVFFFDRTFLSASCREAWRVRRGVYIGLAATWLVLPFLVLSTQGRSGNSGFGSGVSWDKYVLTQFPAVAHYLRLSVWPHPLIFDYGTQWVRGLGAVWPEALLVSALLAMALWAFLRPTFNGRALGFSLLWFFAILAPSSLVPGNRQTAAEHRMYLALAPLIVLAVTALHRRLGRAALPLCLALAFACLVLSWQRNKDYGSALSLWQVTVAQNPANPYAQDNLGNALAEVPGQLPAAIEHFQAALKLDPTMAQAHVNLGNAWAQSPGHAEEAMAQYEEALRLNPALPQTYNNLGNLLNAAGRMDEAVARYEQALKLAPDYAEAHLDLAITLLNLPGRIPEAKSHLEMALRLKPDLGTAREILASLPSAPH